MTYFWFNIYSLQHVLNVSIGAKTYFMRKFFQETLHNMFSSLEEQFGIPKC